MESVHLYLETTVVGIGVLDMINAGKGTPQTYSLSRSPRSPLPPRPRQPILPSVPCPARTSAL